MSEHLTQTIDYDSRYACVEFAGAEKTQDCLMEIIGEKQTQPHRVLLFLPFRRSTRADTGLPSRSYGNMIPNFEQSEGEALKTYSYEDYVREVRSYIEARLGQAASATLAS